MADEATERTSIRAEPDRCYEVAIDFERYPEWAKDVASVSVLERDEWGRGTRVAFRAVGFGYSTRYTLAYHHDEERGRLGWVLEEGDVMRRLDGEYRFAPLEGATEVTYTLAVELVVPLPGFVKRRAEARIMSTALAELRQRCEGR